MLAKRKESPNFEDSLRYHQENLKSSTSPPIISMGSWKSIISDPRNLHFGTPKTRFPKGKSSIHFRKNRAAALKSIVFYFASLKIWWSTIPYFEANFLRRSLTFTFNFPDTTECAHQFRGVFKQFLLS